MTIGKQFKLMRKERKLTLKEAAGDILSVSSLSKFENDTSQLAADRFFLLLDRLNLDWGTFTQPQSDNKRPFLHRYLVAVRHGDVQTLAGILRQLPLANTNQRLLLHLTLHNLAPERFSILAREQMQAQTLLLKTAAWSLLLRLIALQLAAVVPLSDLAQLTHAFSVQVQSPNTPQDHLNLANRTFLTATLRYIDAGRRKEAQQTLAFIRQATVGDLGVEFQIACTKRLLMIDAPDRRVSLRGQQELDALIAMLQKIATPEWTSSWLPALEALAEAKRCGKDA